MPSTQLVAPQPSQFYDSRVLYTFRCRVGGYPLPLVTWSTQFCKGPGCATVADGFEVYGPSTSETVEV